MIDKRDVQAFFDRLAPDWDAGMVRNEAVIARILDNAGVCEGCTVLDVACGTGVLFGDYVKRGAARVTAVDLSPEMVARAAEKAAGTQITVVCGDVEDSAAVRDSGPYDVVMVYNAFPHFPDPAGLIPDAGRAGPARRAAVHRPRHEPGGAGRPPQRQREARVSWSAARGRGPGADGAVSGRGHGDLQ